LKKTALAISKTRFLPHNCGSWVNVIPVSAFTGIDSGEDMETTCRRGINGNAYAKLETGDSRLQEDDGGENGILRKPEIMGRKIVS